MPVSGRERPDAGLSEQGWLGKAPPFLFDRRENPREFKDFPGFDTSCAYVDTEICGRCGAC